jgi:hypothetical protein
LITRETSITVETDKPVIEDKTDNVVIPDTSVETGSLASLKAEIKKEVLTAVIASLQDALKKA